MPEGHIAHRLAQDHQELVGRRLTVTSPQGRFAEGAARLDGRHLDQVEAAGKHLLHRFDNELVVHSHLGMQGSFYRVSPVRPARPQVRVRLAAGLEVAWDLVAPATCEVLDVTGLVVLRQGLGPDPLRPDADVSRFLAALADDRRGVGAVLLDQSVVAGVGNVIRAEALADAGIHPDRPAADLSADERRQLWAVLRAVMDQAAAAGTIRPNGRVVYKQQTCARCGTAIEVGNVGGRTSYACPSCQPPPR